MGKASRDKGARRERQIVQIHNASGVKAERVPLSGAARYQGNGGDIDVYVHGPDAIPIVAEVKARANGEGFATLERWLGDNDALFLIRDRAEALVVIPMTLWLHLACRGSAQLRVLPPTASVPVMARALLDAALRMRAEGTDLCVDPSGTGDGDLAAAITLINAALDAAKGAK